MGKLKFHPLFIIYVFLCLYFGWCNDIFYYVVAVVLHEYGHYFETKKLGYNVSGILISIYGASLNTNNSYKVKDDIKISLAGPLVNVILIVLCICLWWILPTTYVFTYSFVISNVVILLFNLIPIYPLDGGRVVVALISSKIKRRKIIKVNNIMCFVLGIIFLSLFGVSIIYKINLSLLFIGLFLAFNSIASDRSAYFEKISALNKSKKPCEIKVFKVSAFEKSALLKCVSPSYYSVFVSDLSEKQQMVSEDDLFR